MNDIKIEYRRKDVDTSTPEFVKLNIDNNFQSTIRKDAYLFAIAEGEECRWHIGELNTHVSGIYGVMDNYQKKEHFLMKAVKNLLKKNEFLQLTLQMEQELLDHEGFFEELERNEDKYLIQMDENFKYENFKFISHIMNKLERDFSSDEIAELFSVPIELVNNFIDEHYKTLHL
ncbi:hypothetical protein [Flavobacterium kingsejongi]|uniref:Uncharacterized protein n=1 Tax=Flavobacterium kingsejongi TaxID=1678728 RepID=A0A2S1LPA6_9FLAO|nr:hypothetical protein [Flavobacterium kingsejongi]AWG25597.1 hypothetical protein FK004_10325 [Flavobacterium kingsejongi]